MDRVEQRLAEFRARRAKSHLEHAAGDCCESETGKKKRWKMFTQTAKEKMQSVYSTWKTPAPPEAPRIDTRAQDLARTPLIAAEEVVAPLDVQEHDSTTWRVTLLLKVLLWLVLLGLFVELEFGLAFFILSMFYWLYEGTRRPGQRQKGEKSAYSVFNPGCEAIQGSITAEQLEREMMYSPLAGM